jgi:3-dehydroquinate dehydratase II
LASLPQALKLLVLHGPNLDRLGTREPEVYGTRSLADVTRAVEALAAALEVRTESFQSNLEGALVERIHRAADEGFGGIVVNPAAYGHTSVALRDALLVAALPFVEVHLTNPFSRESFRHTSLIADLAVGVVSGFGVNSYLCGLRALVEHLRERPGRAGDN